MNEKNARKVYLDIARGLGILMVVWAHADAPFSRYITSFHMPFFFFLSGMMFQTRTYTNKEYIINKARGLLFPFWGWNLLMFPIFFFLYYYNALSLKTFLGGVFEIILTVDKVPFLGATWFLPSLFWVSVMYKILDTIFQSNKYRAEILFFIFFLIGGVGFFVTFPYRISRTLICGIFYAIGVLIVQRNFWGININVKCRVTTTLLSFFTYIIITYFIESSLSSNCFQSQMLFLFAALIAIYFTLNLSYFLEKVHRIVGKKHLIYLGRNTIGIVIWHFLAFRLAILLQIICLDGELNWLVAFPVYDAANGWWIIYVFTGIYGSVLFDYLLHHNCATKMLKRAYLIR